jgi:hypothetical protein
MQRSDATAAFIAKAIASHILILRCDSLTGGAGLFLTKAALNIGRPYKGGWI